MHDRIYLTSRLVALSLYLSVGGTERSGDLAMTKYIGGLTKGLRFLDESRPARSAQCIPNHHPVMICKSHHVDDTHH